MTNQTRNERERRKDSSTPRFRWYSSRAFAMPIGYTIGALVGIVPWINFGRSLERKAAEEIRKTRVEAIAEYVPQRAYLGDVNGDGFADIIVRNGTVNPCVFLNNWADQFYAEGELTDNGVSSGIMRERAIDAALRPDYLIEGNPPVWTVKVAERIEQEKKDHNNTWKEVEQK
jgi:hypothetical protein